jgi:hypothetical protein
VVTVTAIAADFPLVPVTVIVHVPATTGVTVKPPVVVDAAVATALPLARVGRHAETLNDPAKPA